MTRSIFHMFFIQYSSMISNFFNILHPTVQLIGILYLAGFGISLLFLPKRLMVYRMWLMPWVGVVFLTYLGIILNIGKIPMNIGWKVITAAVVMIGLYALLKERVTIKSTDYRKSIYITCTITIILFLSLFPMIMESGFPTVVSLGNVDGVAYTNVAEYLKTHTLFDGTELTDFNPQSWSVVDLSHYGFRWGPPVLLSYLSLLTQRESVEVYTILLMIFFSFSFPLVYIAAEQFLGKSSKRLFLLVTLTYGFNSTLVYLVYHSFFAQFMFNGIYILSMIFFVDYLTIQRQPKLSRYLLLISTVVVITFAVYPEGLPFVIAPPVLFALLKGKNIDWYPAVRIGGVMILSFLLMPFLFATVQEPIKHIISTTTQTAVIGWEYIRTASLAEVLGLYNLHYSRPLPGVISVIINIVFAAIGIYGIARSKYPRVLISYLSVFIAFFVYFIFVKDNFFVTFRLVGYSLFLFSIAFALGMELYLAKKRVILSVVAIVIMALLVGRSMHRTYTQYFHHHRSVDMVLLSLRHKALRDPIYHPLYTADVFYGDYDLWERLWMEHMLRDIPIITRQNYFLNGEHQAMYTVLMNKNKPENNDVQIEFDEIFWENPTYSLGSVTSVVPYQLEP